jgi:Zn-dependent peptidase ImmA (M78 family)
MMQNELLPVEIVGKHMQQAPVDLESLARSLGLHVHTAHHWGDNISGKIECQIDGPCVVTINGKHSLKRQRFTLAHEIAHFVLHREKIGDGITDDGRYRSLASFDSEEREANRYAAAILMPHRLVREAYDTGCNTARDLSRKFDVSEAVAEIRMRELDLI